MAGGLLSGLGMFLASFAISLTHLYLSIGLLSGFLRDVTGSYTGSFIASGTFHMVGGLVLFTVPTFAPVPLLLLPVR
ncbi:monocarboxylate transporter 13-like [Chrysemys picta bellii]|uniref:monocarboxylate transporter 13-like n=1 Tax=Chrysemys picta bellii TaxID=8478 RepID=UPI0032B1F794